MTASITRTLLFVTHAEVAIDPAVPVPQWPLSPMGRSRHLLFNSHPAAARITSIYASSEHKAVEGAAILATARALPLNQVHALHENDRTATGYLPPTEFERTADAFFANPHASIRGWERAADAQRRIVDVVQAILDTDTTPGDIAVVAHGGVGALLLAHLMCEPISRRWDQPGSGGGNFFIMDAVTRLVLSTWAPIG